MNYQNQLTLLYDILKNQQQMGYGTTDEYSQLHRLAEALQGQEQLDTSMQQTLANISEYCTNGNCAEYGPDINQWLQSIEDLTVPYPHE
ncbi:hypothetical protein H1D32_05745 [Anaerobacillus sp. CMMVII]|uniref:YtzH-like family protein n=1 Tax=Anaerobacillus sp. CMMVII TaxID=2755588 RepID=UPI0021B84CC4|nr:YtzH-like family protein [Anaerobacillus sp. CMMVII]MCT8137290.1 hypothetical protein [Anaerobacillus sp. CMMVII]